MIINEAHLDLSDIVLEVGSGTGSLTELIAKKAGCVLAVEIDPCLAMLTTDTVRRFPHVTILQEDILARKSALSLEVDKCLTLQLAQFPGSNLKLVANLSYSVATPVILNLLVHPRFCPTLMVVTIQRELAERMCAKPKTHTYRAVSIMLQALADVRPVRSLPPQAFWPQPKVDSTIIQITPRPEKYAMVGDVAWFQSVIRRLFLHRRKNLRRVLRDLWDDQWTGDDVDRLLETLGLSAQIRAEDLNVEEHISLAHALKQHPGFVRSQDRT